MKTLAMLFLLAGCAKNPPILAPVNFQTGSTDFANDDDQKSINEAARVLESTEWSVIVLGMADATGDEAANKALAQSRADAVAAQLRTKAKVPEKRIVVHAIGEKLATTGSVTERKVEFIFFEDKGLPLRQVVEESGVLAADFRKKAKD